MKRCLAGDEILTGNGNLCWSRNEAYYRSGEWRGTVAQEGGGVMINQALHTLDLLLWFMGMPSAVVANTANNTLQGVIEVEDTASAIFYFDDGKRFVINATNGCNYSFHVSLQFMSKTKNVAIVGETAIVNGEAQKIAIARALYYDPQIMVLDEATSALDSQTELNILESVKNLSHKPTCIIITHRPAALDICDRILKLESGYVTQL